MSLQDNLTPSEYLKTFLETDGIKHSDKRKTEDNFSSEFEFSKDIEINNIKTIDLPKNLGSYLESLEFYVEKINKDNQTLTLKNDYGYNMTYADDLITSYNNPLILFDKEKHNLDFEFNLRQPDLIVEFRETKYQELKDIISINNLIFGIGINDNLIKAMSFKKEILVSVDAVTLFQTENKLDLKTTSIKQLVIDSNLEKKNRLLILVDFDDNCYIFKSQEYTINENNVLPMIVLEFISKFKDENLRSNNRIVEFVERKGLIYIAYEFGLSIRDVSKQLNFLKMTCP
jgi:hypothetical protein